MAGRGRRSPSKVRRPATPAKARATAAARNAPPRPTPSRSRSPSNDRFATAMAMLRRNVLILHSGALGDFVLAWPLVLALGRLHPQSRIICVTHASKGALAEAALRVESGDIEHGWHGLFTDDVGEIDQRAMKLLDAAHAVYSFLSDEKLTKNLSARASHAQIVSLRTIPPEGWTKHASDWLIEQLTPQPAVKSAVEQILRSIG